MSETVFGRPRVDSMAVEVTRIFVRGLGYVLLGAVVAPLYLLMSPLLLLSLLGTFAAGPQGSRVIVPPPPPIPDDWEKDWWKWPERQRVRLRAYMAARGFGSLEDSLPELTAEEVDLVWAAQSSDAGDQLLHGVADRYCNRLNARYRGI
jgi:hypothetical protein